MHFFTHTHTHTLHVCIALQPHNRRFTMDGTPSPPGLPHTTTTLASWNAGRTYTPLWFDRPVPGTASRHVGGSPNGELEVPGVSCVRAADNRSFTCGLERFFECVNASTHNKTVCINSTSSVVRYEGWPFSVARFTYCSKIVAVAGGGLVQLRAFSHKMNEVGGPDENLAAFGSSDGGATWRFLAVVAARDPVYSAKKWEGPGENDLIVLADGRLLAVFRVESCKPYMKSYSSNHGVNWTQPEALPFGSARPKLMSLPDGRVLLSGGRPGLFLWVGDASAESWDEINLAVVHNNRTGAAHQDWNYSDDFITSAERGVWVQGSTSYTSLLDLGGGEGILQYDRLANGWKEPPGEWGDRDRAFSLRFRYSS